MTDSARILVVDNYDSFVYTIVGYLKTLGAAVTVVRNDAIDPGEADVIDEYDGVLISPGPGAPADSGASEGMIRLCAEQSKPMFGVCLGMQALAEVFGATVSHAPTIMHGKTSLVEHIDDEIDLRRRRQSDDRHPLPFAGCGARFRAGRAGGDRVDAGRPHRAGHQALQQADVCGAVPPRIRDDAGRLPSACELAEGVRPGERRGTFQGIAAQGRGLRSQQEDVGSAKTHGTSDGTSVET